MKSLAIAYNMKRKADKKKMMADGGQVSPPPAPMEQVQASMRKAFKFADGGPVGGCPSCGYAEGGEVEEHEGGDRLDQLMKSKKANDTGGGSFKFETPNEFDDMVLDDNLDEASYTGENSGDELGNERTEDDEKDLISKIMKSRGKKDKLPRPA